MIDQERPGLREIAAEAGVSPMTVSRALNNRGRISTETRARVIAIAERLGYRPDPKLAGLMGHLRQSRQKPFTGTLAIVWPDASVPQVANNPLLAEMREGARTRAAGAGYQIEEFFLTGSDVTPARLDSIIYSRGIEGVILGPVSYHAHGHLRMKWERYAVVSLGLGLWKPDFHRVHHDHYRGMLDLMRHLRHRGLRRIALVVAEASHRRMFGGWRAAFVEHHPLPGEARGSLVFLSQESAVERPKLKSWWKQTRAEALIVDVTDCQRVREELLVPKKVVIATLQWRTDSEGHPGIDQRYALQGSHAVDMVLAQIHRGERGVPESPKILLCRGLLAGTGREPG